MITVTLAGPQASGKTRLADRITRMADIMDIDVDIEEGLLVNQEVKDSDPQRKILGHYAAKMVRVAQSMHARATREDPDLQNEEHAFDLEAMDQYADQIQALATMIRLEIDQ